MLMQDYQKGLSAKSLLLLWTIASFVLMLSGCENAKSFSEVERELKGQMTPGGTLSEMQEWNFKDIKWEMRRGDMMGADALFYTGKGVCAPKEVGPDEFLYPPEYECTAEVIEAKFNGGPTIYRYTLKKGGLLPRRDAQR